MPIREAYGQDVGTIAALWSDLVAHHHTLNPILPQVAPGGDERYAHTLHDYIHRADGIVLVSVDSRGEINGYLFGIVARITPDYLVSLPTGLILDLYVHPTNRRQGIGHGLVSAALERFRVAGVQTVRWDVSADNNPARTFWRSIGGQPTMLTMQMPLEDT
jgi:GNAT superfamily N-acetyltransferase